jgi:hypothetical protein
MASKERILAILRHPATSKLNFRYGGIPIYPTGYKKIADLIDRDRILLRLDSNERTAQARYVLGVGAYQHATNTFLLPSVEFPRNIDFDSALVIHEMTHALMDWHAQAVNELVSEGAAYVAQMMWVQSKSGATNSQALQATRNRFLSGVARQDVRTVFEAAWEIAREARQPRGGYLVQPGPLVDFLNVAIQALPLYSHSAQRSAAYDGI